MQIPGTAAPRADRQPPREMSFRSSGKGCRLFMPDMNPLNLFLCANRVGDAIERVAGNTVNLPNSCFSENLHQQVCYFFLGHGSPSFAVSPAKLPMLQQHGWYQRIHVFPDAALSISGRTTARSMPPQSRRSADGDIGKVSGRGLCRNVKFPAFACASRL